MGWINMLEKLIENKAQNISKHKRPDPDEKKITNPRFNKHMYFVC